ncbi:MAG: restriction endonuclease subunit S [Paludibacteraceae bacterium]|nr:restriction endonuclease subunit S [Paludibacteraceae bacterium]
MVCVPPLAEQQRIVERIEELLPLIEKYDKAQSELDQLNTDIYSLLKKSILQEAIQGRLVPQDPNDEPAIKLLERIRKEKQTLVKQGKLKPKDITESTIFKAADNRHYEKLGKETVDITDCIPFEIPDSWRWVRIYDIACSQLGKTLDKGKEKGKVYKYLCSINVYWSGIDLSNVKTFMLSDDELERYRLKRGDLLICEGGDYGRCSVWDSDDEMYYQNALHRLRFYGGISPLFFKYVFELYRTIKYVTGQGQTIKHFTYQNMKSLVFPLPPKDEQYRIIGKIQEFLSHL